MTSWIANRGFLALAWAGATWVIMTYSGPTWFTTIVRPA